MLDPLSDEAFFAAGYEMVRPEDLPRWRARPGFSATVRRSMTAALDETREGPSRITRTLREFIGAVFVFFLHGRPGGISLSTLRDLCSAAGLPRALAVGLLPYLRFLGYIEPLPRGADRRRVTFAPTARMRAAFMDRLGVDLRIIASIDPDIARLTPRFDEPEVFAAFMDCVGVHFLSAGRIHRLNDQPIHIFLNRNAGPFILYGLVLAGPEGDLDMPPRGPMRYTVAQLARAAHSSRQHVMRVLRDAEEHGLLRRVSDQEVVATPALREAVGDLFAAIFGTYSACARWALKTVPQDGG